MEQTRDVGFSDRVDAYLERERERRERRAALDRQEEKDGGPSGVFGKLLLACIPFLGVFALPGLLRQLGRDTERSLLLTESLVDRFNTLGTVIPPFMLSTASVSRTEAIRLRPDAFQRWSAQPSAAL